MKQDNIWEYYQTEMKEGFLGARARLRFLARRCRHGAAGGRTLNIGVGSGLFESEALAAGLDVYSLDPGEKTIEALRRELALADKAKVGYGQAIPFEDGFFDNVVVSEVIEHLSEDVTTQTLDEVHRVLAPGGRVLGTVPAREKLHEQLVVCPHCDGKFHRWGHQQSFTAETLRQLLSRRFVVQRLYERPFHTLSVLKSISKLKAVVHAVLWRVGIHLGGESLFFMAVRRD